MAYQIIYKKRFINKLFKLLDYLRDKWGSSVSDRFIRLLQNKLKLLSKQPFIGAPSVVVTTVRSILITRQNRIYYRIKGDVIEIINMYDLRSNPKKNPYN